jgi:hypothetical protein
MTKEAQQQKVAALLNSLDIPPSAHEKAHNRYKDLGEWFDKYSPRIYPQDSFRLGTVVRPMGNRARPSSPKSLARARRDST